MGHSGEPVYLDFTVCRVKPHLEKIQSLNLIFYIDKSVIFSRQRDWSAPNCWSQQSCISKSNMIVAAQAKTELFTHMGCWVLKW